MAFGGFLKQSTSVDVLIGPFLDETTGKDIEAGLTIEDEHVLLSKNGQGLAAKNDANDAANDGGTAYYNCPLNTTDTNTVGQLTLTVHISGALPIRLDFQILDTVPYDEMFKDAAVGMQGVIEVNNLDHLLKVDTTVAADGDLENYVVAGTVMAHLMSANKDVTGFKCTTDSLEAIKVHADTIKAETASIQTETTALDTLTKAAGDGDLAAVLVDTAQIGAAVGASISADIAAVKAETTLIVADTNELQTDDYPTSIAAVQTEVDKIDAVDTVVDAIKVVTDNLAAGATTMITGTVSWDNTNATTTVIYSDDITEATPDHYNGRLFVPTSGALLGQYTDITDYALDAGEGKFTVTALTEAPADNTTFVII